MEEWGAHNPQVRGSKPRAAIFIAYDKYAPYEINQMLNFFFIRSVAQWKSGGLITPSSVDRNHALLYLFLMPNMHHMK